VVFVCYVLKFLVLLPVNYSKMDFRELSCKGGKWMELARDRVKWPALLFRFLLAEDFLILCRQCSRHGHKLNSSKENIHSLSYTQ
jgi:hypothetical protein